MAIEAAIVAKDEFIEIAVHVLATQAMIRAETPSLHERKTSMNPRQRHMARHPADDARVMTVAAQCQIGRMAVGEERRARFHIGFDESLNGRSGIVLDRGEADAAGARVEIFRAFAARLGWLVSRSITSTAPTTRILPTTPGSKKASLPERQFPLDRSRRRLREALASGRSSTAAAQASSHAVL